MLLPKRKRKQRPCRPLSAEFPGASTGSQIQRGATRAGTGTLI